MTKTLLQTRLFFPSPNSWLNNVIYHNAVKYNIVLPSTLAVEDPERVRHFYIVLEIFFDFKYKNRNPALHYCCNKHIIKYLIPITSRLLGNYISIQMGVK